MTPAPLTSRTRWATRGFRALINFESWWPTMTRKPRTGLWTGRTRPSRPTMTPYWTRTYLWPTVSWVWRWTPVTTAASGASCWSRGRWRPGWLLPPSSTCSSWSESSWVSAVAATPALDFVQLVATPKLRWELCFQEASEVWSDLCRAWNGHPIPKCGSLGVHRVLAGISCNSADGVPSPVGFGIKLDCISCNFSFYRFW